MGQRKAMSTNNEIVAVLRQALIRAKNVIEAAGLPVDTSITNAIAEAEKQSDIPKIGCVNHDCDQCKAYTHECKGPK